MSGHTTLTAACHPLSSLTGPVVDVQLVWADEDDEDEDEDEDEDDDDDDDEDDYDEDDQPEVTLHPPHYLPDTQPAPLLTLTHDLNMCTDQWSAPLTAAILRQYLQKPASAQKKKKREKKAQANKGRGRSGAALALC